MSQANGRADREWSLSLSAWTVVAAFGAYFCMYAFRKPFTAAGFAGDELAGLPYKSVLVTAQVLGYTLSKFLGIKVIAEMPPARRAAWIVGLIAAAQAALVLFGLTPAPWNFVWLFANGLPLGMVFGLVLGCLEGRRHTEALAAGLCTSFIVADGVVKSAGAFFLQAGVSEYWMPAVTGAAFLPLLLGFVWMLSRVPAPTARDEADRSERAPMTAADRRAMLRRYGPGLALLVLAYVLITILRSVRADFAPEIWSGLGVAGQPAVFALSEGAVGAAVLLLHGAVVLIPDNRRAFFTGLAFSIAGPVLVCLALLGQRAGALAAFPFMVALGMGLYLPYIAVHTTLFERLIAMTRDRANIGYLMYVADFSGYLGYVLLLLGRGVLGGGDGSLAGFLTLSWMIAVACVALLVPCWRYFATHPATRLRPPDAAAG